MTKREKTKLRKAVEESWEIEDKEMAGNTAFALFEAAGVYTNPKMAKAFWRWDGRNKQIGKQDYKTEAAGFRSFRLNDMRLLKDIGA